MKISKKLILASVVLPLIISTSAFAFGGKNHKGPHEECRPGFGFDRGIMKDLDLTDTQKDQLKTLRQANKDEIKKRFSENKPKAEMRAERTQKMNDVLLADTFDPAKATALAQAFVNKQVERQVDMLSKQHKMLSILTPDQKAKFVELQKEHMEDCNDMARHKGKDRK
ncbi:CpxP family protein [Marinomonas foliarum]|uniref:CpxP family protein n=1 Tax=Marinomonas foliarum TaxID=491950 RepID=A0ABX7IRL3_9GAMM|nr:CpxP family protein [Marinomonas foliarum]QRV24579.1 CpxP family protein [Marinomonas foliarum]